LIISEKDLAELALKDLRSHIKENLEGYEFLTINQVLQRALAQESRSKESKPKSDHLGMCNARVFTLFKLQYKSLAKNIFFKLFRRRARIVPKPLTAQNISRPFAV
jgi:hypothetical protein